MDCIIPAHNIRTLCSAISSLAKIGKDLYVEFDPLDGLILRTLNDSKSAFCVHHYQPAFFERCTAPPARKHSQDDIYKCRVPLRAMAAVCKPRKGVVSLRIRNESSQNHLYWSFEFRLERNNNILKVVHRLGVVDADGVTAVTSKEGASEFTAEPRFLLQMMEPLQKTPEVAFVVRSNVVTLASFHHQSHDNNAVLLQKNLLQTETTVGADEFDDFIFLDTTTKNDDAPPTAKREVTLVCTLRECKAFLQYAKQEENVRVTLYFHYGGKPLIWESKTPTFTAQLVVATLDHKLVKSPATRTGE